ncbi:MAG: hypothetical protein ACPGJV_11800 [Bacteriovoracaceae bacterium]
MKIKEPLSSESEQFLQKLDKYNELSVIGPLFKPDKASIDQSHGPIIFIDGGYNFQNLFQTHEKFYIGDNDSNREVLHQSTTQILLEKNKDYSDLKFCLELLKHKKNLQSLMFRGFTGARLDHELMNLSEFFHFVKQMSSLKTIQIDEKLLLINKDFTLELEHSGTFSVFSFETMELSLEGRCEYPLKDKTISPPLSSLTLSNNANGLFFLRSTKPCFLYLPNQSIAQYNIRQV